MRRIHFKRDATGWYHTDTEFFRYTVKNVAPRAWCIYETELGKSFGNHIATSSRLADAQAWLVGKIRDEMQI
jgi:hypothetical protein